MDLVVEVTSKVLRVKVTDILQQNRDQRVIEAQQICALILKARQNSFAEISMTLNRPECYAHHTVARAIEKAQTSEVFAKKLSLVWRELGESLAK